MEELLIPCVYNNSTLNSQMWNHSSSPSADDWIKKLCSEVKVRWHYRVQTDVGCQRIISKVEAQGAGSRKRWRSDSQQGVPGDSWTQGNSGNGGPVVQ